MVRHFRWMRSTLRALLATGCVAAPVSGQTAVQLTAGATSSGVLISDGVLHTKLQPAIAPTVGIALALPTGKGSYRVRLEARYSRSTLKVTTTAGETDNLSSLATIDALVIAEGPLIGAVRWQAGGGALFYRPSDNQGVFLAGPTQRWQVMGGAIYSTPITPQITLLINGRIDAHLFLTDVLRARNYAGSQGVRRFSLQVGIERKV